jgi:hypothetical protein
MTKSKLRALTAIALTFCILLAACGISADNKSEKTLPDTEYSGTTALTEKCYTTKESIPEDEMLDNTLLWNSENLRKIIYLNDTNISEIPDTIIEKCIEKLNNDFAECTSLYSTKAAMYDMNNDGADDYFVLPFPADYAGNGTPPTYLFVFEGDELKVIDVPIKSDHCIKILNSNTNDYYNIYGDNFDNIFKFNGQRSYIGKHDNNILVSFLPSVIEDDRLCIRVSIPYEISDYRNYYLKMCLFDKNYKKVLIATSNDNHYNNIVYENHNLPINGEYCFYINMSDCDDFDLADYLIEFQCIDAG